MVTFPVAEHRIQVTGRGARGDRKPERRDQSRTKAISPVSQVATRTGSAAVVRCRHPRGHRHSLTDRPRPEFLWLGDRRRVGRCGQEMVILPGSVVWVSALSVTATVKVNVPAVGGVLDSPAGGLEARVRPGGICPEGIDQV